MFSRSAKGPLLFGLGLHKLENFVLRNKIIIKTDFQPHFKLLVKQFRFMDIVGMYMLKNSGYDEGKIHEALELLYRDRKNEFHELSQAFLGKEKLGKIPNWREFVLNFCLDVSDSFKTWTNQKPPSPTSPQKALTILRQIGDGMKSMNELTKILNIAYTLAVEFKEIYNRIK